MEINLYVSKSNDNLNMHEELQRHYHFVKLKKKRK